MIMIMIMFMSGSGSGSGFLYINLRSLERFSNAIETGNSVILDLTNFAPHLSATELPKLYDVYQFNPVLGLFALVLYIWLHLSKTK